MSGERRGVPKNLDRALRAFYGGKECIVRGNAVSADWAHIDEDPSHTYFGNVIPLSSDLNQAMARVQNEPISGELSTEYLRWKVQELDLQGAYSRGYACARLGAYLALSRERDPDKAIELATFAVHLLRPLDRPDLVADTLDACPRQIIRAPALLRQVSLLTLSQLAREISVHFEERGFHQLFLRWFCLSICLARGAGRLTVAGHKHFTTLRRYWAFHLVRTRQRSGADMVDRLSEVDHSFLHPTASTANAFWQVSAAKKLKGVEAALGQLDSLERKHGVVQPGPLQRAHGWESCDYSNWVLGALLQLKADLMLATDKVRAAMDLAHGAFELYSLTGIRPIASATSKSMEKYYFKYGERLYPRLGMGSKFPSGRLRSRARSLYPLLSKEAPG